MQTAELYKTKDASGTLILEALTACMFLHLAQYLRIRKVHEKFVKWFPDLSHGD